MLGFTVEGDTYLKDVSLKSVKSSTTDEMQFLNWL